MVHFTRSNRFTLLTMMAFLLSNIFIFSPQTVYITNIGQFTVSLFTVLESCLIPVLVLFLLFYPVVKLIPDAGAIRYAAVLATLSVLAWIQGNVLLWEYGLLDGKSIVWSDYEWRGWIDGGLWTAAILVTWRYKKIATIAIKGALFVFILQLLTACYTSYQNWDSIHKEYQTSGNETLTEIFNFSKTANVLHIVVDGFQSDVFDELMHHATLKDKYRKSFQGFEYYRETLGAFPYTIFAVPAFLAGELYSNQSPKGTFIDDVLKGSTILSAAKNAGYEIDLATGGDYMGDRYANLPFNNLYNLDIITSAGGELKDPAVALELALFRVAPHFLKRYIYNDQKWLLSRLVFGEEFYKFGYFSHTYVLNKFIQDMKMERRTPVYKYLHIMNTHNPMVVDERCQYSGKPSSMTRNSLTIQSFCTLDTLSRLLDRMKEMGVYDNTLIIIHGDHGGWVPNYRQGPPATLVSGETAPVWMTSLASPLLAIKKPNDKAPFRSSEIYASLLDIPATIADIMDWDADFKYQSLEELKNNGAGTRERFFRFYFWQRDAWEADYTNPIQEFRIDGSHYEAEWKLTRVFYPPQHNRGLTQ